mgnify:CR=1 FL=1
MINLYNQHIWKFTFYVNPSLSIINKNEILVLLKYTVHINDGQNMMEEVTAFIGFAIQFSKILLPVHRARKFSAVIGTVSEKSCKIIKSQH